MKKGETAWRTQVNQLKSEKGNHPRFASWHPSASADIRPQAQGVRSRSGQSRWSCMAAVERLGEAPLDGSSRGGEAGAPTRAPGPAASRTQPRRRRSRRAMPFNTSLLLRSRRGMICCSWSRPRSRKKTYCIARIRLQLMQLVCGCVAYAA
jgi:hypothetical protein